MKYRLFYILLFFSLFSIKNGTTINNTEANISYILFFKYIFIHHPLNNISLNIQQSLKEISPNNLTIIDILHITNPIQFLKDISKYLDINKTISVPLLIKKNNNNFQVYNNNPSVNALKKFLNENAITNSNNNKRIYNKINYEFLSNVVFNQGNCLIIFYIKNYKSKKIMKKIITKIEKRLNVSIAYTDITNKFSYKLFDILEGYENNLPCLRYIKFQNNKLFFTKKEKIDLLDVNITDIINQFVNDSLNNKLFYNLYNSAIFKKNINHFNSINNYYYQKKKKNIIEIYYNDWCEFCLELLNIIDEILEKNECLLYYFEYKKYLVANEFDLDYNNDNYFNFLPRLHISDNLKNVTYEYCGDLNKDDILKFVKDKIDIIKYNILITKKIREYACNFFWLY